MASSDLPAVGESVGDARRYAVRALDDLGLPHLADDVRAVVSELATNAVLHARTPFTVVLTRDDDRLRVRLVDQSPGRPRLSRLRDTGSTTGRGLHIVAELSTAWGVEVTDAGKAVWCDLPLQPRPEGAREHPTGDDLDLEALLAELGEQASRGAAAGPASDAGRGPASSRALRSAA